MRAGRQAIDRVNYNMGSAMHRPISRPEHIQLKRSSPANASSLIGFELASHAYRAPDDGFVVFAQNFERFWWSTWPLLKHEQRSPPAVAATRRLTQGVGLGHCDMMPAGEHRSIATGHLGIYDISIVGLHMLAIISAVQQPQILQNRMWVPWISGGTGAPLCASRRSSEFNPDSAPVTSNFLGGPKSWRSNHCLD